MKRPSNTSTQSISFGGRFIDAGYEEVILPAIWEQQTFVDKAGPEIVSQMWTFPDKGGRDCCLIPEVTGLVQEVWRDKWSKQRAIMKLFYVSRCYRYERPQAGRYREFTQFGIEILGGPEDAKSYLTIEAKELLLDCIRSLDIEYLFENKVKRGLSYYIEDGFEVLCPRLGAQKQIAGGGRYAEGVGWAIGVDRLLLALQ